MPNPIQSPDVPFIEVDYAAKIVFMPQNDRQERPNLRAAWQQSQGLWKGHPVFQNMAIGEVMTWLRGDDSDV